MNKIVYSQLSVATVDGTAHHIVMNYAESKNEYQAWKDLVQWYEGDSVRNEIAEELRSKMENLLLHSGMIASHYINKFLQFYHDLNKIPGEGGTDGHGAYLFLKNIVDLKYATVVLYLHSQNADLKQCVNVIRKTERDLAARFLNRRKLKTLARRIKKKRKKKEREND